MGGRAEECSGTIGTPAVTVRPLQSSQVLPSTHESAGRNANGALMQQYGANAWKVHNYRLEMVANHVEKAIEELNERIAEINRSRKNSQVR